jgi:hypothetical protein
MHFPTKNGSTPPSTTAPSTDVPNLNADLPAGFDDESSTWFVPVDARPGYHIDTEQETIEYGAEMSRAQAGVMGWYPGPTAIRRERFFDQAYAEAKARALAAGDAEHKWPAPEQLSPAERRRRSGVDPMAAGVPDTPDAEAIKLWQHRNRIDRALREVAAVREQIAARAAHDTAHRCAVCALVSDDVSVREVLHVRLRICGPCEPILGAGLISILAREQVTDGRSRGEVVSAWLGDNAERWAGLQFPATPGEWSSPTPPRTLPGQDRSRPPLPPTIQTGRML